jgi:4-amino-4-deoxy-L-arabinose transferase-like glycosyltransferase
LSKFVKRTALEIEDDVSLQDKRCGLLSSWFFFYNATYSVCWCYLALVTFLWELELRELAQEDDDSSAVTFAVLFLFLIQESCVFCQHLLNIGKLTL